MRHVGTLRKVSAIAFLLIFVATTASSVQAVVNVQSTIANANTKDSTLESNFFKGEAKVDNLGIQGNYFNDKGEIKSFGAWQLLAPPAADFWTYENVLALKAFSARKLVNNDPLMSQWAVDLRLKTLDDVSIIGMRNTPYGYPYSKLYGVSAGTNPDMTGFRYAATQFQVLEALGEYAQVFQDDNVLSELEGIHDKVYYSFQVNWTDPNNPALPNLVAESLCPTPGGPYANTTVMFWTCINQTAGGVTELPPSGQDYMNHTFGAPLSTTSFWAAIGLARVSMAVVGSTADVTLASGDKFSAQTADEADGCMVYPDVYCYTPFYGLYKDSWSDTSGYHLDTQALALLAFSRLYQATQKEEYITRADALINAIMQYFFVGGLGAGADFFSSGVRGAWINGSSNAMLAMALGDLYKSTGNSKYSGLCQDIATFMNKYMWDDAGNVKGYCEYFNVTSLARAGDPNNPEATANAKLMSTNAMMMYANEMVMYANRSFWDIYGFWVIVGSVLLIAIIAVVILVSRRRSVGTKLSKTVKGLISEA